MYTKRARHVLQVYRRKPTSFHGRFSPLTFIYPPAPLASVIPKKRLASFCVLVKWKNAWHALLVVSNALLTSSSLQEPRRAGGVCNTDTERERGREELVCGESRSGWLTSETAIGRKHRRKPKRKSLRHRVAFFLSFFFFFPSRKMIGKKKKRACKWEARSVEERTK